MKQKHFVFAFFAGCVIALATQVTHAQPKPPIDLKVEVSSSSPAGTYPLYNWTFSWRRDPTGTMPVDYQVRRHHGGTWYHVAITTGTSYEFTNITPGVEHRFQVSAFDSNNRQSAPASTGPYVTPSPLACTATIHRLGVPRVGQQVYVMEPNLTKHYAVNMTASNGTAGFAVPRGTTFRFLAVDADGFGSWSNVLTLGHNATTGVNATIKMFAPNTPTLITANGFTANVGALVTFNWNSIPNSNIAYYGFFYRHSSMSNFAGIYAGPGTSYTNGFGTPGTWEWVIVAYDSSNEAIAQSQIRNFTIR
jgi:hypothetical protein